MVKKNWLHHYFPLFAAAMVLIQFFLCSTVGGASTVAGDSVASRSCVTGECHNAMGRGKYVHGPVAAGECTFCHIPEGRHKFKPIRDVGKLCQECHDQLIAKKAEHGKDGKCSRCHDPHQSPYEYHLRTPGASGK